MLISRTALTFLAILIPLEARSQIALNEPGCTVQNGDVNADGVIDVSDVITILGYLYLGNPHQLTPVCPNTRVNLLATGLTWEGLPDCPHMDGFYALGCPAEGRFVDNKDDTITDLCTGLMWQKYLIDVNRDGRWGDADSVPLCDASELCETSTVAGYTDWRLPTVFELESLHDFGNIPAFYPIFNTPFMCLWSSTPNLLSSKRMQYIVCFGTSAGFAGDVAPTEEAACRPVRTDLVRECVVINGDVNTDGAVEMSDALRLLQKLFLNPQTELSSLCRETGVGVLANGQAVEDCSGVAPAPVFGCPSLGRFIDHEDGTISDLCTGLMWQKYPNDTNGDGFIDALDKLNWCEAGAQCDQLMFAGYDDWRLPNIRELLSIADLGRTDIGIDPIFGLAPIDQLGYGDSWSSTTSSKEISITYGEYGAVGTPHLEYISLLFYRAVKTEQPPLPY